MMTTTTTVLTITLMIGGVDDKDSDDGVNDNKDNKDDMFNATVTQYKICELQYALRNIHPLTRVHLLLLRDR